MHLTIRSFASIPPKPLDWLWTSRIPRGKITLLAGDPGTGKTALTLDLAARLSNALPMPHDPPLTPDLSTLSPSATLLLSPDDNAADTLRPKLDALHANLQMIHTLPDLLSLLPLSPQHSTLSPEPSPLDALDAACSAIPNLALLIIDPITHYLGLTDKALHPTPGNTTSLNSPRSILHALANLAQKHHIAILLTSRLSKKIPDPSLSLSILHRTLGSLAFASSARSILLLLPHPTPPTDPPESSPFATARTNLPPSTQTQTDPQSPLPIPTSPLSDSELPTPTHLLLTIKSNLTQPPPTLAFTLAEKIIWHPTPFTHVPLPSPRHKPTSKPKPLDPLEQPMLAHAIAFLHTLLADGPIKATRAQSACVANTISPATLRRAKIHLNIACTRSPEWSAWFWSLPTDPRPIPSLADELRNEMSISELFAASFHSPRKDKAL